MAQNEEDWFYDSISRYKNLSMFEIEYPVYQMELASKDSISVSCSDSKQNQLLELVLPLKLTTQAGSTITNDTDLKIRCGTFLSSRIAHMRNSTNDRMIIASHQKTKGVHFYKLSSDDSDKIEQNLILSSELESPALALSDKVLILTKTSANPMAVMDIETGHLVRNVVFCDVDSNEELVSPAFLDSKVVSLCSHRSGTILLYDTRDNKVINTNMVPAEKHNVCSFCTLYESSPASGNSVQSASLAMVLDSGVLKVFDSRNWHEPYVNIRLEVKCNNRASVHIRFKPFNKCWISVSGFDGNVYVYKVQSQLEQVFVHDGHRHVEGFTPDAVTSSHLWLPSIDNLIISSAYNGTIQSWQFEDNK